ncbi:MAG: DNA adenine methylase [Pseudomonadota bacterium]|nr:DNA adenine methylase [Pseudomonadota bacterium]
MSFKTPLRYPGGKGRLGPWLAEVLRHNRISGGTYVEPYAGGAGAALFLLLSGYVNRIVINDADPLVYAFWKAATVETSALAEMIRSTPVNMLTWGTQKEIIAAPERHSQLELGFATFFLNRTNRSGIIAGGVIGGRDQRGPFKLDARYNKGDLVARIEKIGSMAAHIGVTNHDALDLLHLADSHVEGKGLIYLDPPYFHKGSLLYRNHYKPDDHAAICDKVRELRSAVLVSYDNAQPIRTLYADIPYEEFSLRYSTHSARPHSTEVMFYRNLALPRPPQLTRAAVLPPARADKATEVIPEGVH